MRTKGSTEEDISKRRELVMIAVGGIRNEGEYASIDAVWERIKALEITYNKTKSRPYSKIARETIAEDLRRIDTENTFVRDLSQYHYSALKENVFATYQWIYKQAKKNYEKTWTLSKTTTRETKDGDYTEIVTTEEIAGPKASFLNIMKDCSKSMDELLDGKANSISTALISRRFVELEHEVEEGQKIKQAYDKLVTSKK